MFPPLLYLVLLFGLLLCFPLGIFPLPVSIITVQSTPDTYGHDITANGLPPKKQQTILCYMVRLVIFTHLLLTLLLTIKRFGHSGIDAQLGTLNHLSHEHNGPSSS